jgi:hypothetical protein
VHSKTIDKITRGLYFHNFKSALPLEVKIETYFFLKLYRELKELGMSLTRRNIGGDDCFVYAFDRVTDNPVFSLWMYQFYRGHWAAAITAPASDTESHS